MSAGFHGYIIIYHWIFFSTQKIIHLQRKSMKLFIISIYFSRQIFVRYSLKYLTKHEIDCRWENNGWIVKCIMVIVSLGHKKILMWLKRMKRWSKKSKNIKEIVINNITYVDLYVFILSILCSVLGFHLDSARTLDRYSFEMRSISWWFFCLV